VLSGVISQSSTDRSSSPIAPKRVHRGARLRLGGGVPSDFAYTPCRVMSMSKRGSDSRSRGFGGPAPSRRLFRLRPRNSLLRATPRWRETDSNFRFRRRTGVRFWPFSVALWAFLSARKCAVAPGGIEIDYEVTIKALACRISGRS